VTKILLVDDHSVVRQGLKQILTETWRTARFGEASTASEAHQRVQEEDWDLVILDITMPGRSGFETLKQLKEVRPNIPVLILSVHADNQYVKWGLKSGAAGYVTKDSAPEELTTAVRKLLAGQRYISPALAERMAWDAAVGDERAPHERLSDRELQVLRLIASGKTVTQIAEHLTLSVKTISTYRARILEKMEMETTAELIHYAVRNGLVVD
jgi:two-component system, NarL family, invasion response regulator UvrY